MKNFASYNQRYKYLITSLFILTFVISGFSLPFFTGIAQAYNSVPGENYDICNEQSQYLTSPWTYDALSSGNQSYTVAQYEALTGYGTTLPPLPSYIGSESAGTTAAVIFAPGSTVDNPAYDYPATPILYFFEGGAYTNLGLESISGDEFIGGTATGYPEPTFNNEATAKGIDAGNGSFYFSGGSSTLAASASAGATTITTTSSISGFIGYLSFSDGSTYQISNSSGTSITLYNSLSNAEASGSAVWANQNPPIAEVASNASQGATSVTFTGMSDVLVPYQTIRIGADQYQLTSVSGNQSGYTVGISGGLDIAVNTNTPIYSDVYNGDVTVEYLDINDDQHVTTGTIFSGSGWTIEHNNIHDGYSNGPGNGVAVYGGDQGTIEYNCLSKMGDYGVNIFGKNNKFDYNEIYETNYEQDPGCGCSGGGKWWGTLNADIVDNAFIDDGPGGSFPIWLDNGNSGTLIQGNYFDESYAGAISEETGFNLDVTGNLFLDDNWGDGTGCGGNSNCAGAVGINSSGGFTVPNSRYENEILISNNQFINNWGGVTIWQSGARSCENSGEGYPNDASYCSGGFPNTASTASSGQYYFSHIGDTNHGGSTTLAQSVASGSATVLVQGAEAIDDQIGFGDPASTTTSDTANVSTFSGSGTINATTTGFPSSGQLRVQTSNSWGSNGGSWTGAILSYTGTTGSSFTGVSLVRGSGTLAGGPILEVQPYKVTSETCYANDCALTISPSLTTSETASTEVSNAGTCQLYATDVATPTSPLAPDGTSYWDGCQWESHDISVTDNTFDFQPSLIASSSPLTGGSSTLCNSSNNDSCGTNFMAYQEAGQAPFEDFTGGNAMMSSSSFTGCPSWDSGCTNDPLNNLNALSSPPGATENNGEGPGNNVWSDNTYSGPWAWNAYVYGTCALQPTDPNTGKSMPSGNCDLLTFPQWQSYWQQESSSTNNPLIVSLSGLTSDQDVHGASQSAMAYEDTLSTNTISTTISLNSTTASSDANLTSSPFDFSLKPFQYPDGLYTIKAAASDSGGDSDSDSVPVYIDNGDLNSDGKVSLSDLAIMAAHWGQTDNNYSDGNLTGDSTIGNTDLSILAANWGWVKQ